MAVAIVHSAACQSILQTHVKTLNLFDNLFPNYCQKCKGWGGFACSYDPSPSGVSLGSGQMFDVDPCEDCEGGDPAFCALCRAPLDDQFERTCGHKGIDGKPEPPECICDVSMRWD